MDFLFNFFKKKFKAPLGKEILATPRVIVRQSRNDYHYNYIKVIPHNQCYYLISIDDNYVETVYKEETKSFLILSGYHEGKYFKSKTNKVASLLELVKKNKSILKVRPSIKESL